MHLTVPGKHLSGLPPEIYLTAKFHALPSASTYYYTLNSLSLFWLVKSLQWIFEISACDVISADYTIIMLRTPKVTGNHVKLARFVLLAVSEEAKTWLPFFRSMYSETIIRFGFCDMQNNQGLGKGYQPQPSASADNPYLDLDYSGYHKTSSNNCLLSSQDAFHRVLIRILCEVINL